MTQLAQLCLRVSGECDRVRVTGLSLLSCVVVVTYNTQRPQGFVGKAQVLVCHRCSLAVVRFVESKCALSLETRLAYFSSGEAKQTSVSYRNLLS